MNTHKQVTWNDFGDMWSCYACGSFGSPMAGDRPEDSACVKAKTVTVDSPVGLVNAMDPLDKDTAGTAPIPASLRVLKDSDLAQRIATSIFGVYQDPSQTPDPNVSVTVIESMGIDVGQGLHEVAYIKATGSVYHGGTYEYHQLVCAHDYEHLPDSRFQDTNGEVIRSGRSSGGTRFKCMAKAAANLMKRQLVMEEFITRQKGAFSSERLDRTKYTDVALELLERYELGEWLGIEANNSFYVQHLAELLGEDFGEANRVATLLEDQGLISRSGNILMLQPKQVERPTRLWATYGETNGNEEILAVKIFIPASDREVQDMRVEVRRRGELYQVIQYSLRKPLTSEGLPAEKEIAHLQIILASRVDEWRRPYSSPYTVPLTLNPRMAAYERFSEPKPKVGHGNLSSGDFGDWYCSVCETSGDGWVSPSDVECIEK